LLAFGVISVIMLFPMGIKAQQLARFQLYAAAKAEELVECFSSTHNANPAIDSEAPNAWDVPVSYRSQEWDLESRVASHRFGVLPLPLDLARRLDSDGDEIQKVLAEGGYLYYSQPMATSNLEEQALAAAPPNEAQRLVFAITGYAQSNAMHSLAQKDWPYENPYPSPPLHGPHKNEWSKGSAVMAQFTADGSFDIICPEASTPGGDPDIKPVFDAYLAYTQAPGVTDETHAIAYLQAAMAYAALKLGGDFNALINPASPLTVSMSTPASVFVNYIPGPGSDTSLLWKQVQSLRFVSHAATCLTRWKTSAELGGGGGGGLAIPALGSFPGLTLTQDLIAYYHERSLRMIMLYAASCPYDWACPRPLQRSIMMDYPLMEWDLFSPPASGKIFSGGPGMGSVDAAQWKPIAAQPVQNPGCSYQYPASSPPAGAASGSPFWGQLDHFTLTRAFEADERCRQIVFWAVDWQSYEDCESAPSAPVDASKYPFRAPVGNEDANARMNNVDFRDEQLYCYRNPEKVLLFSDASAQANVGADVSSKMLLNNGSWLDKGSSLQARQVFSGQFGADRNFNKRFDRGPVPRSVRMRAMPVGRFNFYDPRLPCVVR
nr:hypothetical protein [Planctomycetota bacterium]